MRILAISPTSGLSGVDQTFLVLCSGLAASGAEVIAVMPPNAKTKDALAKSNVEIEEVRHMHWWFPIGFTDDEASKTVDRSRTNVRQLLRIISRVNPDIVISNTSVSLDGAMAAMISGKPHLVHLHAMFVDNIFTQMSAGIKSAVYELFAGPNSTMVVPAIDTKRQLAEVVPAAEDHIHVISNGVDTERFRAPDFPSTSKTVHILSLGHFNANKNQMMLVDVARDLTNRGIENFKFVLAGPAEAVYLSELRNHIDDNNVAHFFEILDSRSDVLPLLHAAHIYTNSSTTETFPVSLLEAMSTALPCVCSPTVGAREIVEHGITGFIGTSVREMADQFATLILDSKKRRVMGAAGRNRVQTLYSSESFITKFLDAIRLTMDTYNQKPLPWLEKLFFGKPQTSDLEDVKRVAIIIPDWSLTSCVLLIQKPFAYIQDSNLDIAATVYSYGEISRINLDEIDLLYVFRLYTDPVPEMMRLAKVKGIPIIFETDDNYFALSFKDGAAVHESVRNPGLESILSSADKTIVYSQTMEDDARRFSKSVVRLRPYQLVGDEVPKSAGGQVIGFMGTLKKDVDFEFVVPALERLLSERPQLKIEFFGFVPDALQNHPRVEQEQFDPNYDDFIRRFRSRGWTVGLAPLADTAFNRSKTNNKYREYSAAGYAGVYSNVSPYADCVVDQTSGLLVENDTQAWYQAITRLLGDPELRNKIIANAFDDIRKGYRFKDHVDSKLQILRDLIESRDVPTIDLERIWIPKKRPLSWSVDIAAKPFRSVVLKGFKGVLSGVELVPLEFIDTPESSIGVEIVHAGEIVANVSHPTAQLRKDSLNVFNFPLPLIMDGDVEIRVFARSQVGKIKVMGFMGMNRRGPLPILALLVRKPAVGEL